MDAHAEFLSLVKATLSLLQEEKRPYVFASSPREERRISKTPVLIPKELPEPLPTPPPIVAKVEEKQVQPSPVLPSKELLELPSTPVPTSPPVAVKVEEKQVVQAPRIERQKSIPSGELDSFDDLKKLLHSILPELRIASTIPTDKEAKKISERYLYKNQAERVTLLVANEPAKERLFLENLGKAIGAKIVPMDQIEKKDEWDSFLSAPHLKLLIACDYSIWEQKNLMKHYKEIPSKSETLLGNVSLFMLGNLSLYFKEPLLKRSLWKALCQKLSLLDSPPSS